MHNWRDLLVSIIEILVKHSVLVPANKLNRGVTVNRCWQSDKMKDSHPILEETDSDPAAMRLSKVRSQSSNHSYWSCS